MVPNLRWEDIIKNTVSVYIIERNLNWKRFKYWLDKRSKWSSMQNASINIWNFWYRPILYMQIEYRFQIYISTKWNKFLFKISLLYPTVSRREIKVLPFKYRITVSKSARMFTLFYFAYFHNAYLHNTYITIMRIQ